MHTTCASLVSGAHNEKERLNYGNVTCAWPYVYSKWRDIL